MTDAPKRIWAYDHGHAAYEDDGGWTRVKWEGRPETVEYLRADLVPSWQPVETAPKDGTVIVSINGFRPFCAEWSPLHEAWIYDHPHNEHFTQELEEPPTHWMPLPEPPDA